MVFSCYDETCTHLNAHICTKYGNQTSTPVCAKVGVKKSKLEIETNEEYLKEFSSFKEFINKLENEINALDLRNGNWSKITSFGIGMNIIDSLSELVYHIEQRDNEMVKRTLLKMSAMSYKMWRLL